MDDDKPKKMRKRFSYKPPVALLDEFVLRVKRSGLSVNAFLTRGWHEQPLPRQVRRPPLETKQLAKMLFLLAQIRDELRRIERDHSAQCVETLLDRMYSLLLELRAMFFKSLGRRP